MPLVRVLTESNSPNEAAHSRTGPLTKRVV
jgi:hypothetical protein